MRFLDDVGAGKIVSISGNSAMVLRDDGFELEYKLTRLVMETPSDAYRVPDMLNKEHSNSQKKTVKSTKKRTTPVKQTDCPCIDLHIEELIEDHTRMTNAEIMLLQLSRLKDFLRKAEDRNWKRFIVIHGVGEGVLKEEVLRELRKFENLEYFEASYAEFGRGATEFRIRKW